MPDALVSRTAVKGPGTQFQQSQILCYGIIWKEFGIDVSASGLRSSWVFMSEQLSEHFFTIVVAIENEEL